MDWLVFIAVLLLAHSQGPSLVSSRRIRHAKMRGVVTSPDTQVPSVLPIVQLGPKPTGCEIKLSEKCNCTNHSGSATIICDQAGLTSIPALHPGPGVLKTLSLNQNHISSINMGAFFGVKIERLLLSNNTISKLEFLAFWGLEFKLENLDMSHNLFTEVPFSSLRLLRNLRTLILSHNRITSLRDFDFGHLRKLDVLALDNNPISAIAANSFYGTHLSLLNLSSISLKDGLLSFPSARLKYLKGISLANNKLTQIPQLWVNGLKHLSYLNLDNNELSQLPAEDFQTPSKTLATLELNYNKFQAIPEDLLRILPSLQKLKMHGNNISKIDSYIFNLSTNLQELDLSNNVLSEISIWSFLGLDKIKKIDLRHNQIITLDDRTIYWDDPTGKEILMGDNPFLCNCMLKWLKIEFKHKTDISRMFTDALSMICDRPHALQGARVIRLRQKEFTCNHNYYYYYTLGKDGVESLDNAYDPYDDGDDSYEDYNYNNYHGNNADYADFDINNPFSNNGVYG